MDNVQFVYTVGMDEDEVEEHLQSRHTGVLAVADDGDAYAIPISYVYEGDRLFLRFSDDGSSEKLSLVETTGRATFLVFDYSGERESWSVLLEGSVRRVDEGYDETALNEAFPPLRVFDEPIDDLEVHVREFVVDRLTARRTA